MLLKARADPNVAVRSGDAVKDETEPLVIFAARAGLADIEKLNPAVPEPQAGAYGARTTALLLDFHADVNATMSDGTSRTLLHFCAESLPGKKAKRSTAKEHAVLNLALLAVKRGAAVGVKAHPGKKQKREWVGLSKGTYTPNELNSYLTSNSSFASILSGAVGGHDESLTAIEQGTASVYSFVERLEEGLQKYTQP